MLKKLSFVFFLFLFTLPGFCQEEVNEAPVFNPILELNKLGYRELTATSLLDEKVVRILQRAFRDNQLQKEPPKVIRHLILEKAKGSSVEWMVKDHPKFLDMVVDILRDKEALSSLVGIFLRKGDLKFYFFLWIGLLIVSHLIRRYIFPNEWGKIKRFIMGMALSFSIAALSLTVFYNMFKEELRPTAVIVLDHWERRGA